MLVSAVIGCSEEGSFITPQTYLPEDKTLTLSWTAPTEYTDGSPLSIFDIGGYKIYYGKSSRVYDKVIKIEDAYTTKYEFKDIDTPTYFSITCYTIAGIESHYSNEILYKGD